MAMRVLELRSTSAKTLLHNMFASTPLLRLCEPRQEIPDLQRSFPEPRLGWFRRHQSRDVVRLMIERILRFHLSCISCYEKCWLGRGNASKVLSTFTMISHGGLNNSWVEIETSEKCSIFEPST